METSARGQLVELTPGGRLFQQLKLAAQLKEHENSIRDAATGELPKQPVGLLLTTFGTLLLAVPAFC